MRRGEGHLASLRCNAAPDPRRTLRGPHATPVTPPAPARPQSRYEFELFSGVVTRVSSEALTSQQSVLLAALRLAGVWRQPPTGAVHEVVVQTPGGQSRAFRFATETADVPAFEGQRVTVVCAPTGPGQRRVGILSTSPPGERRCGWGRRGGARDAGR